MAARAPNAHRARPTRDRRRHTGRHAACRRHAASACRPTRRQGLVASILSAPVKKPDGSHFDEAKWAKWGSLTADDVSEHVGGAGLDLQSLLSADVLKEAVWVHDDKEVADLSKSWRRGCAGIRRVSFAKLRSMHDYFGSEVAFYFGWVAFYTRFMWLPAIVGAIFQLIDACYIEPTLSKVPTLLPDGTVDPASADERQSALDLSHSLTTAFVVFIIVWATVFEEKWKQRAATLKIDWGESTSADSETATLEVNPRFKAEGVRTGFYTKTGGARS